MDKESYQSITIGHVTKRGTKGDFSSPFLLESGSRESGEQIFENGGFLERESATSL